MKTVNEMGRTLVEMLSVLAIMGILSITAVWAYNNAMNKHKANTLIDEAQKRAVVVAAQIGLHNQEPSYLNLIMIPLLVNLNWLNMVKIVV